MKPLITTFFTEVKDNFRSIPFIFILGIGVILRLLLVYAYDIPTFAPDTHGYKELASYISKLTLDGYSGSRTPGYPLFLFLSLGKYYEIVAFVQFLLNIATVYFIYDIIKEHSKTIAFIACLLFYTLMRTIFYEIFIIAESTTLFLVTTIIWTIKRFRIIEIKSSLKQTTLISLLLGTVFLFRPMFIYITPVLAFFMCFNIKRQRLMRDLKKICIILIIPFSLYIGWSYVNYYNHGWFTVTTFTGITKAQIAMPFFHKVSDEHKEIKDVYSKHINEIENVQNGIFNYSDKYDLAAFKRMYENGAYEAIESLSIWRAHKELIETSGLTHVELSKELNIICNELIVRYPQDYFKQVWNGWLLFWVNNDIPINYQYSEHKDIVVVYRKVMDIQKYIFTIINILLIPTLILCFYSNIKNKTFFNFNLFVIALIGAASVAQAMVTYGEGARFAFPLIGLIIISVSNLFVKSSSQ